MKNIFYAFFIAAFFTAALCIAYDNNPQVPTRTPETTIIAIDLHGVLLQPSIKKMIGIVLSDFPRWRLLRYLFDPTFLYAIARIIISAEVTDQGVDQLCTNYPELCSYTHLLDKVINAQEPIPDSLATLSHLKEKGYSIYLLSNIGPRTLGQLCQQLPYLCTFFTGMFTPRKEDNWLSKPSPRFYLNFMAMLAATPDAGKNIVFIDDRQDNIHAAENCGFTGVLFTTAAPMKEQLKAVGVIID